MPCGHRQVPVPAGQLAILTCPRATLHLQQPLDENLILVEERPVRCVDPCRQEVELYQNKTTLFST